MHFAVARNFMQLEYILIAIKVAAGIKHIDNTTIIY